MFIMTSLLNRLSHQKNSYLFELHVQEVTCTQKLKFVLAFKSKKTGVFYKHSKKVLSDDVILV